MRREEPPEDRKLSVVKSWFSRSVSSGALHGSTEVASDGSPDLSVSKEGGVEDREIGGGFAALRQLSMRRSRPSGEIEKESGLGSPSMTPRNVTPLTPLTPLKWKSNPREQEEEEKALDRSKLGSLVAVAMPIEEISGIEVAVKNAKDVQVADLQQQGEPVSGTTVRDRTKAIDAISVKAQLGVELNTGVESCGGHERKPSSGDDVMTMTIEFLRARLLSERSASKAAKQRVQQLGKKVAELELKLEQAIEERKKAEVSAEEALLKLKTAESSIQVADRTAGEAQDRATWTAAKGSLLPSRSGSSADDIKEELQQDASSTGDLSRTNSNGSSNDSRNLPATAAEVEEGIADRRAADVWSTPKKKHEMSTQKQESRAAIENRLRNMWHQISEEMTALAEERSQEFYFREELMSWMGQVPTVLQDIVPKKPPTPVQNLQFKQGTRSKGVPDQNERDYLEGVSRSSPSQFEDAKTGPSPEGVQDKGQLEADAKRAAVMLEEYEAQESVQREWERNYYESQQRLEQFKGDNHNVDQMISGQREYPCMDDRRGPHDSPDDPSFLGLPPFGLAKSKSSSEFVPMKPNGSPPDVNAPHFDGPYADPETWNGERYRRPAGAIGGQHESMYNNAPVQRRRTLDPAYLTHPRMPQERSAAPPRLPEAGHHGWSERQLVQEQDPHYQQAGNRGGGRHGGYPPHLQRGPLDRAHRPSTNRSPEDAYRSSQQDYRGGRPTWDDRGDWDGRAHQQGHGERGIHYGYGDANGRTDRDHYYRQREREDPYQSLQPEGMYRPHHRRSLSDNSNWPAVEDYDLPNRPTEHGGSGVARQHSYSGYPGPTSPEPPPGTGFKNANNGYEDLRHRQDAAYGAHAHRRDSFPSAKADHSSRQHFPPQQADTNGYSKAEPQLSLGYGPAYDAPIEDSPLQQSPKDVANKNVGDVLRALQIAKANIQKSGSDKIPYTTSSTEKRLSGEQALPPAMKNSGYGMEPPTRYPAPRQVGPGLVKEQFRYTKNLEHGTRALGTRSLNSSPNGVKYDPYDMSLGREARPHPPSDDVVPEAHGHSSYVDQLNVGQGIQFFFS